MVTIVLLAAALALAGNMATNTVQVSSGWWPYAIWGVVALLVIATIAVEVNRARDALDVTRVSRLTDPIKLGVHPAASVSSSRVPPFIARDRLPDLENALRTGGFVLVVGDSTAGKTRLAYEAMRRVLPRHLFIRPRTPDALPAALALAKRKRRSVLWLDDLERYLGFHGLAELPRCVVLATMRTHERDDLSHRHDPARSAGERQSARVGRDVLNLVTVEIRLDRMWSQDELALAGASDDSRITQALASADKHGIAESMAAGPQLLREWQDARDVRGAAIVAAAVDVRLAGYHRPLPLDFLRSLHTSYLDAADRPGSWEAALQWAAQPLHGTSSLLEPSGDGFLAFDYLVDATAQSPAIPTATWEALIEHAAPADLVEIAWQASYSGQLDQVERVFDLVLDAGLVMGAMEVATCLGDAGRTERAVTMLEQLVDRAEGVVSAEELLVLRGNLVWEMGQKVDGEGDPVRALALAGQVADDCAALLGAEHPDTLAARLTLARQLGGAGQPGEALLLATGVGITAAALHGADHWVTRRSRFEVASWTWTVHGAATAAPLFLALAQQLGSLPAVRVSEFVDVLWNLGGTLLEAGDAAEAVSVLADAADQAALAFGNQHERTLRVRLSHLEAVAATGDPGELAASLAADCVAALGPDHPTTVDALRLSTRHGA